MAPPIDPNLITLLRLPLAPLAAGLLVLGDDWWGVAGALACSILLEITDAADGFIARRYNAVTDFGKLFDPFADSAARFTLFLALWAIDAADLWMILIIFYRDSSIAFFRGVAATRNFVMAARATGKIKALVQAAGVNAILVLMLVDALTDAPAWVGAAPWWIMLVITVVTGASFFDYLAGAWPVLRAGWTNRPVE